MPHAASSHSCQEPAEWAREHLWALEGESEAAQSPQSASSHRKTEDSISNDCESSLREARSTRSNTILQGVLTTAPGLGPEG